MNMSKMQVSKIVLEYIHSETGWGNPLLPLCESEDLFLDDAETISDGTIRVTFRYHFNKDGFSQYDKIHILEGSAVIDASGTILDFTLEETYTGPATTNDPYISKS